MRQNHKAGEKLFVDFSGLTVPYFNEATGDILEAEIFVAVLGASNYTFALAVENQSLPNWIYCHIKAFQFFHGVPEILVPDNLKAGVNKACRYDPEENQTYLRLAEHYSTAIIPARAYRPKDKSKVEVGVQIVQRWILALLRRQTFSSVAEINVAIVPLLKKLNEKVMRHLGSSRKELFYSIEKNALKPLPDFPFEISTWKKAKVNIDYHIEVEKHYYSVPFRYVGEKVDVSFSQAKVEIFFQNESIAVHKKSPSRGRHSTIKEHMPPGHAAMLEWTPEKLLEWAKRTGPHAAGVCEKMMISKQHPQQGYRSCLGLLRLGKKYSVERLEAACKRALALNVATYASVKSILQNNLDTVMPTKMAPLKSIERHENIRGAGYYN